jgi:hypothetical protein
MYQFGNDGWLKSGANKHHLFISNLMLRRGIITTEDTIGQKNPMPILGNARSYMKIKVKDTIPTDSLFIEEMLPLEL